MLTDLLSSRGSLAQAAGNRSHRDFSNQGINRTIARNTCVCGPSRCAVLIIELTTIARTCLGRPARPALAALRVAVRDKLGPYECAAAVLFLRYGQGGPESQLV